MIKLIVAGRLLLGRAFLMTFGGHGVCMQDAGLDLTQSFLSLSQRARRHHQNQNVVV